MTADIVNLRRIRKAKARTHATERASSNRVTFGRTGVERDLSAARSALAKRHLDGHCLVDAAPTDGIGTDVE